MGLSRYLPRFRQAQQSQETLRARETWSRHQIDQFQLRRLNELWEQATAHVPYYRRLAGELSLPTQFESLGQYQQSVPILPKAVVRHRSEELVSERTERGHWHRTAGSTGTPMGVFWGKSAYLEMLRTRYRFYAQWGLDIFDRVVFLWGQSSGIGPGLRGRVDLAKRAMLDRLRHRLRLSAHDLSPQNLRQHLRRIERFRPAALYGYSTALYLLAREALEDQIDCPDLKVVIMTSEPTPRHFMETIEQAFGVPAISEYGSVESVLLAGEARDRTLRVREDVVMIETLPRPDGRYDIVPTILTNPSFPLLRYEIEDVTDAPLVIPESGFAVLQNISGRDNDILVSQSGKPLHPLQLQGYLSANIKNIRRYHLYQNSAGRVTAYFELETPSAFGDIEHLESQLSSMVGGWPVEIHLVDALPLSLSGKHRFVVSDLARQTFQSVHERGGEDEPTGKASLAELSPLERPE